MKSYRCNMVDYTVVNKNEIMKLAGEWMKLVHRKVSVVTQI